MRTHKWADLKAKMSPERRARNEARTRELIAEVQKLQERDIRVAQEIMEELKGNKTLVFAFGRFNPPTRGHEALILGMAKKAKLVKGDMVLFVSSSNDRNTNPLLYSEKVLIIKKTFPKLTIGPSSVKNPLDALDWGKRQGYGAITMMIGDDDGKGETLQQYQEKIETWKRKSDPDNLMAINVEVIPRRGAMDPKKIKGELARELARKGDFEGLRKVMMSGMTDKMLKDVVAVIQARLGAITEEPPVKDDRPVKESRYDDLVMETIMRLFEEDDDAASDMTPDVDDLDVDGTIDSEEPDDLPTIDADDPYDKQFSAMVINPRSHLKVRVAQKYAEKKAVTAAKYQNPAVPVKTKEE